MKFLSANRQKFSICFNQDDKDVSLRAAGTQPLVEVEISEPLSVEICDLFLLCSDGLRDMLDDTEIQVILNAQPDTHAACDLLIEAAKNNCGHDNITAGIVRIGFQDTTESSRNVRATREVEVLN